MERGKRNIIWTRLITFTVITAFLCQNIVWANSSSGYEILEDERNISKGKLAARSLFAWIKAHSETKDGSILLKKEYLADKLDNFFRKRETITYVFNEANGGKFPPLPSELSEKINELIHGFFVVQEGERFKYKQNRATINIEIDGHHATLTFFKNAESVTVDPRIGLAEKDVLTARQRLYWIEKDLRSEEGTVATGKGTCLGRKGEVGLYRLDDRQKGRAGAAIDKIKYSVSGAVSNGKLTDAEGHLAGEVIGLLEEYFARGDILTFDAIAKDREDYLLAFPLDGKIALAKDFLDPDYVIDFYHTLPVILFRVGSAVRFGEDCEERGGIYSEMQKKIFGEGDPFANDLLFYIDLKLPGEYEIEFDQATRNDKKIDINRIEELLRDKEFIFGTLKRLYRERLFLLPHTYIGKLEVRHGGTGSQKQTLHVSFKDETTGFECDFALKTAINRAVREGFAKGERDEIPTLKELSDRPGCKIPRFGVYIEEPGNNFYAYTEEWIFGPTADQVEVGAEKLTNIVAAYLSVMKGLDTRSKSGGRLAIYDVQPENVMFESRDSDSAVTVDIGKINYVNPLHILQEFDRHYGRGDRRLHKAIFDGVMKLYEKEREGGIALLEEAADKIPVDRREVKGYTREMAERLSESLKEYLRDLYIKKFTGELSSILHESSFEVLRRLALAYRMDPLPIQRRARSRIFEELYNDAKDTYENDKSLSNELGLEAIQLIIKSVSKEDINLEDLLNRLPNLDLIERLLDISFLLSIVAKGNIHYRQLPDRTTIIDFEEGRPKLKDEIRIGNTYPAKSVLDPLELTGNDVYLSLGGGAGVYNIAALLRGVGRSIWLDISPNNVPFVRDLKKYYSFIRDNQEMREEIENKAMIKIKDFVERIMNMHGIDESQSPPLDIIVEDAANIPLEDNSVTKMSILELFHWVEIQGGKGKVVSVIREALRVTRPGGLILFSPDKNDQQEYYKKLFSSIAVIMGVALRLKEVTPIGALLFEVISKPEDIYSGPINKEKGLSAAKVEFDANRAAGMYKPLADARPGLWGRVQAIAPGFLEEQGVSLEEVTVYGITSIVKTGDDFVHGYFDRSGDKKELFLSINIMEEALACDKKYGTKTLEEYIEYGCKCKGQKNHQELRDMQKRKYTKYGNYRPDNRLDEGRLINIIREDTVTRDAAVRYIKKVKSIRELKKKQKIILALDTDIGDIGANSELLEQIREVSDLWGNIEFIAASGSTTLSDRIEAGIRGKEAEGVGSEDVKVIVVTNKTDRFREHNVMFVVDGAVVNYVPVMDMLSFALTLYLDKGEAEWENTLRELYKRITGYTLEKGGIKRILSFKLPIVLPPVSRLSIEIYKPAVQVLRAA